MENGETTYIVCRESPDIGTKIIYFDDIQHKVSTVLTSMRNETFKVFFQHSKKKEMI